MAISGDYSSPVRVNGFSCRNCSEVDQAKRNIDPANPAGGPFGINDHGKSSKSGAARNHFSPDARQQDVMAALHKARAAPPPSAAAAAYGAGPGGGTSSGTGSGIGQFVSLSA